ncbi:hypothetical protein IV203_021487 [Nitzschia inconspicua]|uniref:Uncharacterized protein n=1 Tax=Nitzschia inconspicua TaxID=303405 RepID=A0A9K3PDD6_9STRA|nr:hypothetical protein IV203_022684 [Nitzschia inconspicua]KAG7343542.1 hypothetical protein IV203_021487 [Nitzschia inconspicua]
MTTFTTSTARGNTAAMAPIGGSMPLSPLASSPLSSSCCSFEKTISMNNLAVQHMGHGDHNKAIKALTVAFFSFRKVYHHLKAHPGHQTRVSDTTTAATTASSPLSISPPSLITAPINTKSLFYRRPSFSSSSATSTSAVRRKPETGPSETKYETGLPTNSSHSDSDSFDFCRGRSQEDGEEYRQHEEEEEEEEEDNDDHTEVSIYSHPIYIPADFAMEPEATSGFISTAITFNLALANHLQGMDMLLQQQQQQLQQRSRSTATSAKQSNFSSGAAAVAAEKHLISAGKLYEYTLRLERARSVSTITGHFKSSMIRSGPMILMSVLNNLGQLHIQLDNIPQSKKCFAHLQSLVLCWMQFTNQRSGSTTNTTTPTVLVAGSTTTADGVLTQPPHHELIQRYMENSFLGLEQLQRNTAVAA